MKLKCLLILVIVSLAANVSAMERKKIGVGVIIGQPTGITAKYMLDDDSGIDAGAGWETSHDNYFHIYGDYLFHLYDVIEVPKGKLPIYFGGGVRWVHRENKDDKLGIRIPGGVEYIFEDLPLAAFLELVPVLNLSPDTDLDVEAGTGIRFFF
ncbi:MAG: hypothetical protein LJE94_06605 [Deltaproteobacteria bacterium]|nr:hypothetical protein [Deltaproteobacteria bacterium]